MEKDLFNDIPKKIPGLDKIHWIERDRSELGHAKNLNNGSWRLFDINGNVIGDFEDFDTANLLRRGTMYYKRVPHGWVNCSEAEAKRIYMNAEMGYVPNEKKLTSANIEESNREMGYVPEEWRAAHPSISDEERRRRGLLLHDKKPTDPSQMGE